MNTFLILKKIIFFILFKQKILNKNTSMPNVHCYIKKSQLRKITLFLLLFMFLLTMIWSFKLMTICEVVSDSMVPTINVGEKTLSIKQSLFPLKRNSIIMFKHENIDLCKRIVGIPKDRIIIKNEKMTINGIFFTRDISIGDNKDFILKENEYFVMGDNVEISYDSRHYGTIKKENIKSIILFKIYPIKDFKMFSNKKFEYSI